MKQPSTLAPPRTIQAAETAAEAETETETAAAAETETEAEAEADGTELAQMIHPDELCPHLASETCLYAARGMSR